LSTADSAALVTFVDAGGVLVMYGDDFGRYADVLNSAFGWSISHGEYQFAGAPALLDTVAAAGTVFFDAAAAVPASTAIYFAQRDSLPIDALSIYNSLADDDDDDDDDLCVEESWLFLVPRGPGGVAFIGNDFYASTQDVAWLDATCKSLTPQLL
jgi:hypothetical protein